MKKVCILDIIRNALYDTPLISRKIFDNGSIPENISNVTITLSSIDYIDLMICIEKHLGIELPNECVVPAKISFYELAKRIERYV